MEGHNLNKMAASATLHCLTGCAIGEVAGMIIATAAGWNNTVTFVLAVALAFMFGFGLSLRPLLTRGMAFKTALPIVLASDTLSITTMEITDNTVIALIPGAIHATLSQPLFWLALALSLAVAFVAAYPVNRYLLSKGKGHALIHQYHEHK